MTDRWTAAALLSLGLLFPGAALASGVRVDAMGLEDYIQDEEEDLDLNPAFAAFVDGDRLFANLDATFVRTRTNTPAQRRKIKARNFFPSVEYLGRSSEWAWAARWSPSWSNSLTETRNYVGGNLTTQSVNRSKVEADLSGRLLLARSYGDGSVGVSFEHSQADQTTHFPTSMQDTGQRSYAGAAGWVSGSPGEKQVGVSLGSEYTTFTHDHSAIGTFFQDFTDLRLGLLSQKPVGDGAFLRVTAESTLNRNRTRYPADVSTGRDDSVIVFQNVGAGLEAPAGPTARWTLAGFVEGALYAKSVSRPNGAAPDVVGKTESWQSVLRFGLEKQVVPGLFARARADLLEYTYVRVRDTTGVTQFAKRLNGPVQAVAVGMGYAPREDVMLDLGLEADATEWSNTGGFSQDNRAWDVAVDAALTVRFGGSPEKPRGKPRRG